ncbi:MAG TPA: LCP family protein [Syntrophomonadaceae bacterium]|nr:LCP family protein [Syntrophomonadaceae bacterium]HPR93312.1 LCP family protein [Syntrophomonadaceae bacterium]
MTKMQPYLKFMLAAGLAFGLFFGIGCGLASFFSAADKNETAATDKDNLEKQDGERTNILVMGVDARPGEENSRSDTMMLVSIDPKLNKVAVVSIPRDTKAKIKGSSTEKIAVANYYGGPKLAVSTVEELLEVEIDNYITVDFNGFKDIIDTLGGVKVTVPQRMYKPSEDIDLKAGTQKLDGSQALALVRYRDYAMGDIQRTAQQQEFIKALAAEVLKPATITKLPKLVKQLNQYVETDMGITAMLRMASWAPGFNSDSVVTQTLPGYFYDEHDEYGNLTQSYWIADNSKINNLIDNLFAGKNIAVVTESPLPASSTESSVSENQGEETDDETSEEQAEINENQGEETDGETSEEQPEVEDFINSNNSKLPGAGDDIEAAKPAGNMNTGPEGYI